MSGKYQGVIYQPVFISILPSSGKDLNKKKKAGWYNLFQAPYFLDERRPRIKGKYRKMPFLPIFPLTKIPTPTAFLLVWIFAANHVLGNLSLGKKN